MAYFEKLMQDHYYKLYYQSKDLYDYGSRGCSSPLNDEYRKMLYQKEYQLELMIEDIMYPSSLIIKDLIKKKIAVEDEKLSEEISKLSAERNILKTILTKIKN